MTAKLFDDILVKGIRAGQVPAREKTARQWFRQEARKTTSSATDLMKSDRDRLVNNPAFGSMYLFAYDAKHKGTLPYWDRYPLIFPFAQAKGGFYGLNMHYLPYPQRAVLMDRLYDLRTNDRFDETTKISMSYETLNEAARYKWFRPCVKHYLRKQVRSRFMTVYPSEWDIGLFLPVHDFQGASATKVWQDSRKLIREYSRKGKK